MIDTTTMKDEAVRFRLERDGAVDLGFYGWLIGKGEHGTGGNSGHECDWTRGTVVRVYVTTAGRIVTVVMRWSRWRGERSPRHDTAVHATPGEALNWLREDNGGSLGDASKYAWETACAECPALEGCDVEEVE
jgi:hypothetical protein